MAVETDLPSASQRSSLKGFAIMAAFGMRREP